MPNSPENKPSFFIDRARSFLGIEEGRSRWEYLGAGFKLAAAAEGGWAFTDFITGHPLEGSIKTLSALGIGLVGHMLHNHHEQFFRFRNPRSALMTITGLAVGNLAFTGMMLHFATRQESFTSVFTAANAVALAIYVEITELTRQELS